MGFVLARGLAIEALLETRGRAPLANSGGTSTFASAAAETAIDFLFGDLGLDGVGEDDEATECMRFKLAGDFVVVAEEGEEEMRFIETSASSA